MDLSFREEGVLANSSADKQRGGTIYPCSAVQEGKNLILACLFLIDDDDYKVVMMAMMFYILD
jgi:hypothetical protein